MALVAVEDQGPPLPPDGPKRLLPPPSVVVVGQRPPQVIGVRCGSSPAERLRAGDRPPQPPAPPAPGLLLLDGVEAAQACPEHEQQRPQAPHERDPGPLPAVADALDRRTQGVTTLRIPDQPPEDGRAFLRDFADANRSRYIAEICSRPSRTAA